MARLVTYYQKERFVRWATISLMLIFLVINLFPIFWMIFCSFKNNMDILGGNVGFSRARTDVVGFYQQDNNLYVFSKDGAISAFDARTKQMSGQTRIKGQDINYAVDFDAFYLTNSNKGIFKLDRETLKKRDFAPTPVKDVDTNKLGNTAIVLDEKYVYYTVELRGLTSLFVYEKKPLKLVRTVDLNLDKNAFIRSLALVDGFLYIGTNDQLIKMDKSTFQKISSVYLGSDYYPAGVQKIKHVLGNEAVLLVQNAIFFLDMEKEEIVAKKSFGLKQFEDVYFDQDYIIAAHVNGLSVIDRVGEEVVYTNARLIKELKDGLHMDPDSDYNSGEVTAIWKSDDEWVLGSSYGRISFIKNLKDKPFYSLQLPVGYRLVKFQNYIDLWKNIDFGLYLKNSIIVSSFTMVFAMIFATITAYALVRYKFPGNKAFGISVLSTQMIPQIMYLIPLFMMFKFITDTTGIPTKGTYAGLIFIYTAFFVPFSIWILRSFFSAIPVELEDSARIDGCNAFQVFYRIALPLAFPGIIATGIYIFLTAWDELMFAWVLTSADTMTIPIGIRLFVGNYQNRYDLMMAAATVATLPVLALFFSLQKHIVKGLTAGAVKG